VELDTDKSSRNKETTQLEEKLEQVESETQEKEVTIKKLQDSVEKAAQDSASRSDRYEE